MDLELERFLENQTEMLGNLTITDSVCIDTLRDICERYYELKKLRVADVRQSLPTSTLNKILQIIRTEINNDQDALDVYRLIVSEIETGGNVA